MGSGREDLSHKFFSGTFSATATATRSWVRQPMGTGKFEASGVSVPEMFEQFLQTGNHETCERCSAASPTSMIFLEAEGAYYLLGRQLIMRTDTRSFVCVPEGSQREEILKRII